MTSHRISGAVRRAGPVLGLLVLVGSLIVGADAFGTRKALFGSATPAPRAAASSRFGAFQPISDARAPAKTALRSQPWWQTVAQGKGTGPGSIAAFATSRDAIQRRVTWSCARGRFVVRRADRRQPLINRRCGGGVSTAPLEGRAGEALQIQSDGPWTASVQQQVDVPLVEPPLPAMRAPGARPAATGSFYRIDQVGKGRMTIYRLANGRYALRLRDFYVTPNVDLEIRLTALRAPHSTRQYLSAPSKLVAPLDITAGSMNFLLPAGVNPRRYRSVVIWCPNITSAYAAATLKQA